MSGNIQLRIQDPCREHWGGMNTRQRSVELSGFSQTDLLDIPSSLAAGIYFIRAVRAGDGKVFTRELVVL